MPGQKRIYSLLAAFLFLLDITPGQTVTVQSIVISGLKRTRETIIHRELTFAVGDTLTQQNLGQILERNRNNLLNLGIFNEAIVNIAEWDTERDLIDITIEIKESWYIYAVPILELADRNFNVWWTTYDRALNRLNLGARLEWLNFTGRNDKLKGLIQVGFTPKQEIEYRLPYFNKKQSIGITTGFQHSINKEISYATIGNREQFIRLEERILQEKWQGDVTMVYRPSLFLKYEFMLGYQRVDLDQEVVDEYNPVIFRNGDYTHSAVSARFTFEYDDRDIRLFPSHGVRALFETEKTGFGKNDDENNLVSELFLEWNASTGRRFQHRITGIGQYSWSRSRPSLMHYDALGSSRKYISGYELYIINGLDAVIGKYQLAYRLLETQVNLGRRIPMEQFRRMPVTLYCVLQAEGGYVHDPFTGTKNPLSNRWLYGGGPGVGVMLYNNFLFQFNFSGNHRGEWGLFVHNKTSF